MSPRSSSSSSGEEDGNAEWRAAVDSVTSTTTFGSSQTTKPTSTSSLHPSSTEEEDQFDQPKSQNTKYYQLKAQQLLDDMLEKTIEVVSGRNQLPDEDTQIQEGGIQLFKHAPRGIVFDHVGDEFQGPNKKPRILPGEEIKENSKFKLQVQAVAIDGNNIIAAAKDAFQKSLAKIEARESMAKAAAKREEERVAELKRIRGERWLPYMAKERQAKILSGTENFQPGLIELQNDCFLQISLAVVLPGGDEHERARKRVVKVLLLPPLPSL